MGQCPDPPVPGSPLLSPYELFRARPWLVGVTVVADTDAGDATLLDSLSPASRNEPIRHGVPASVVPLATVHATIWQAAEPGAGTAGLLLNCVQRGSLNPLKAPEYLVNTDFKVTFLGTLAASASIWSSTSACLVQLNGTKILIDAGIGALRQLRRADASVETLDAVLLTHWHPDHVAGLRRLINARKNSIPLPVIGPELPGSLRRALRTFCPALLRDYRTVHGGQTIQILDMETEPVDTVHRIPSVGWKLIDVVGGRSIVVSGDTRPVDTIASAANGADLLVHEATYLHRHLDSAVRRHHSTALEAARLAEQAEVGALILTHTSPRLPVTAVAREAEAAYPGTVVATPLSVVWIERLEQQSGRTGNGWARLTLQSPDVKGCGYSRIRGRPPLLASR